LLAEKDHDRVLTPVHPGFGGTPRPQGLNNVAGLAVLYSGLLDELGLDDVTVIGNSVGGWIAAELALLGTPRVSGVVLLDAVGIEVESHPVADVSGLPLPEIQALSLQDPSPFRVDPAYGKAYAGAIHEARFELLPATGHMPQMETPRPRSSNAPEFGQSPLQTRIHRMTPSRLSSSAKGTSHNESGRTFGWVPISAPDGAKWEPPSHAGSSWFS
jgi:pimeloyl-ACP methyl ester carboxylesterase